MSDGARILTLDIETSPAVADVWSLWNNNVSLNQLHEPTRVICFASKWYDGKPITFRSEYHSGREVMVNAAHGLLDEADIVVTYNGDKFDLPHLNREFLEAGYAPPSPFKSVDLCKVVKKQFRFISNKLAHVTERLELSGKLQHTGHDLWVDCMKGDPKAWALMRRYNRRDVLTTEELYTTLLPWITNHPSVALYVDDTAPRCPKCNSERLERRGFSYTQLGKYQRYQCLACGGWARGGKRIEGVDVR